jgi:hypothetical protein
MNNNYIRPSGLYEWTLNNLHTLSDDVQETILPNLQHLKWVPDMLEKLSPYQREIFKLTMYKQLEDESFPFCPMSITCIIYNLRKYGIDVSDLENLINTSEKIRAKMEVLSIALLNNRTMQN